MQLSFHYTHCSEGIFCFVSCRGLGKRFSWLSCLVPDPGHETCILRTLMRLLAVLMGKWRNELFCPWIDTLYPLHFGLGIGPWISQILHSRLIAPVMIVKFLIIWNTVFIIWLFTVPTLICYLSARIWQRWEIRKMQKLLCVNVYSIWSSEYTVPCL